MDNSLVHVVYELERWSVSPPHEEAARSHHATRDAACHVGRALAMQLDTDLVVHEPDGRFVSTSYRSGPVNPSAQVLESMPVKEAAFER